MKIARDDLRPSLALELTGDEPWLASIYADFPVEGPAPKLTGRLTVTREEAGSVLVRGALAFAPFVPCSRCDKPLQWPLDLKVEARFMPPGVNEAPRERNLSRAELDAYYLEDDAADLEGLINDVVQTALPSRIIAATPKGDECRVCHADLTDERVYGTGAEPEAANPFAVLKGLKVPH